MAFLLSFFVLSLTWLSFSPRMHSWRGWSDLALGLSFTFQTFTLAMETLKVGHLPLHNLYGSVLFLSCLCTWLLTFYAYGNAGYKTMVTRLNWKKLPPGSLLPKLASSGEAWRGVMASMGVSNGAVSFPTKGWKPQTSFMDVWLASDLRQSVFPTCQGWALGTQQACQTQTYRATACIVSPLMVLCHLFCFYLPYELKKSQPLIPALQSHWLEMHVVSMLASYTLLFCGGLFAFAFLFYSWKPGQKRFRWDVAEPAPTYGAESFVSHEELWPQTHFQPLSWLDLASYRTIGLGFAFLTTGLISGAVWANETWSTFWSWDVKETWALITWLIFAMYLHTRLFQGWHGKKSALFAGLGFVSVWITYLGVNLLSKGLHSYGFLFPN